MNCIYTSSPKPEGVRQMTWVKALRQQCPIGSRIHLTHMDDFRPIAAGITGTLESIDDMGIFHTKWDNGRYLGAVPRVDQFEVFRKEDTN